MVGGWILGLAIVVTVDQNLFESRERALSVLGMLA
jgi:hypothetical protein